MTKLDKSQYPYGPVPDLRARLEMLWAFRRAHAKTPKAAWEHKVNQALEHMIREGQVVYDAQGDVLALTSHPHNLRGMKPGGSA